MVGDGGDCGGHLLNGQHEWGKAKISVVETSVKKDHRVIREAA